MPPARSTGGRLLARTGAHYRRCYDRRGFLRLLGMTAGAAVLAHGGVDAAADRWRRRRAPDPRLDALSGALRPLGERFWFLVWAGFAVLDTWAGGNAVTRWGRRNFQTMVVGLPALWTIQRVGGASRPTDAPGSPRYRPFADDNTASGHTFVSAIPWLHLARARGGGGWRRRLGRAAAWAASWGTGWSRFHDGKHYLSQVLLGYAIAWHAVAAVDAVEDRAAADVPAGDAPAHDDPAAGPGTGDPA